MTKANAVEMFLAGRRVFLAKFGSHRHKVVESKGRVIGVVNLFEVTCGDGKAPTVQTWCPRDVLTLEGATARCPCVFKEGQRLVVEFDLFERSGFDAKNGVLVRGVSLVPFE